MTNIRCLIPGSLAYFAFACLGSVAGDAPVCDSWCSFLNCLPPYLPDQFQATSIQVSDNRGPERYATWTSVIHNALSRHTLSLVRLCCRLLVTIRLSFYIVNLL